jgi:hypothetical protein
MLRRAFLSGFPALTFLQAPVAALKAWQAARHSQDDWLDANAAKHRIIFDTWTADRFPDALLFTNGYVEANKDYEVDARDLAVVICVRHNTAPFAFNDAMWAKYGKAFSQRMQWVDPATHEAPATNIHARRLEGYVKLGVQLAVCSRTTRAYVQIIARQTGAKNEDVYKELTSNTVGNSHFVPAGIVAVSRAVERGYTNISIG